ncbi:serine/threonine-protein phosphatase 6 regulatory ankyrin repeat subunit B-like [Centruroides vittatus]|uniref:serine/threonine-protein phosphatase 6 regulatory ankyrin repeat subunit B-like n=1 Tax=Centruroides vittatus TaxID=120091 RepID=UPI00350F9DAE
MYAVRDNRLIVAEKLIDIGINVNARNLEGMTALCMAASNVKEDMIKLLLSRKADPHIPGGPKDQLPIHILCSRPTGAALAPLQMLLRVYGKEARMLKDKEGDNPLLLAVECGNHGVCRELLLDKTKEQLEYVRPTTGDSVIHLATLRKDLEMLKFLVEAGATINAQNHKGETPLHYVARDGDMQMIKYFYQHGADPNLCDINDRVPLHLAAENGHNSIIELLIEKFKASIFLRTKDGDTLMHIASKAGYPNTAMIFMKKGVPLHMPNKAGAKCLHTAALGGHVDVVRTLLQKGEQVDAKTNDNFTALHIAVQANQPQVVEILLGYGAQVQIKAGKEGETPLHIAARVNKGLRCSELLLKSGAEVNARQETGETPIHVAAKHGHLDTVMLLLSDGAGIDIKTQNGETPLHVAVKNCHFPVARSLLEHWQGKHSKDSVSLVNQQNVEGESAMHYAGAITKQNIHYPTEDKDLVKLLLESGSDVNMENKAMKETSIHYCSREGNEDILKEILEHLSPAEVQSAFNRQSKYGWSPLLYACRAGHPNLVKVLLQHGARVDIFDESGKAALHLAAEYGHHEVVDILLQNNAFVNSRSKKGLTPLHLAAKHGYNGIVQHLVADHGAVLDALTLIKKTPLHLAAEKGKLDVCSTLLELNADAHAIDNQGQTPLLLAAENDHPEIVKLFLHHKPELVSMANSSGFTCAHIAAMKGSVAVIKELMKFNRHLVTTARNKSNNTALHLAAAGGHAKLVKVLLEAGASATDENGDGYTALHLAAKHGHVKVLQALKTAVSWRITSKKTGMAALHVAASFGQTTFVREMLTQLPANIRSERPSDGSSEDYGFTPLHLAADNGHEGTVRVLLNSTGVQTDASTELQGILALHMAARGGHLAAAGLLLSRSTEQLHATDKQGRTPLHMAAANGHKDMVGLLLGQGSDINTGDNNGLTALHYTAKNGYLEVVQLLIDSGASPMSVTKDGKVPLCLAAAAGHYNVLKYLLRKEHDTQVLMDDKTFLVDLMVSGKAHNNKPILDFILVSAAPIDTAVKMARSYQLLALKEKDRARDLENTAAYCETMAADLLSIAAMSYNTGTLLRSVDTHNTPFLDVLIELQQKEVVAHPAVQKYLSDLWMGSLQWSTWKIVLLFLAFMICPVIWVLCSCPLGHKLSNIPIIKFMSYLVSHIFFIFILGFTIINPWVPLWESANIIPQPQEWLVLLWLIGILVSDVTNPKDREGLGYIKVAIMWVTSMAIVVHLISYIFSGRSKLITLYTRNQLLAVSLLLCFLEFLNFLTFHHLFGPWTVIIRDLIKDLLRFLAILAIFLIGFSLHVCAIYQPVFLPPGNDTFSLPVMGQVFQSPIDTFEMLFFALFGLVEPDYLPPMHLNPYFSKVVMKIVFGVYMMVTVVVLINLLIAMMSNTYQRIQAQSDTEWKFGRAKLIRNMNKTSPSPSPVNLFTILPTLLCKFACRSCKCRRFKEKIPTPLQSKRSSVLETSSAPKVWLDRTRQRRGHAAPSNLRVGLLNNLNLNNNLRVRPISRVVDWPMIVAKYLEVTGGKKISDDNDDDEKAGD